MKRIAELRNNQQQITNLKKSVGSPLVGALPTDSQRFLMNKKTDGKLLS
jgi:hypothetical protein